MHWGSDSLDVLRSAADEQPVDFAWIDDAMANENYNTIECIACPTGEKLYLRRGEGDRLVRGDGDRRRERRLSRSFEC